MRTVFFTLMLIIAGFSMSYSLYYTVKVNDNLWSISKKYNVESDTIMKINELWKEHIYSGQILFIPDAIITYTIQSGDNLSTLAQTFHTQIKYIIIYNNLAATQLQQGQALKIPVNKPAPDHPKKIIYTVVAGDSLSRIAHDYGVNTTTLKKWNSKQSDNVIVGERLNIYSNKIIKKNPQSSHTIKKYYIVQSGDSMSSIARKYAVTIKNIRSWNNKTKDTIFLGEKLLIKTTEKSKEKSTLKTTRVIKHKVRSGDNLSHLAQLYGVSINDIKKWNNLKRDHLYIAEILTIHADNKKLAVKTKKTIKKKWYYTVRKGDNLSEIAVRYKVSIDSIVKWNKKKNKKLYVGERLVLYSDKKTATQKSKTIVSAPQIQNSVTWSRIQLRPVAQSRIKYLSRTPKGIILHLSKRSGIKCIAAGTVEYAGLLKTKNYVVIINLGNNKRVVYGYMSQISVSAGDKVKAGDYIGVVDYLSIHNTTPLLLELYQGKKVVDIYSVYPFMRKIRYTAFK